MLTEALFTIAKTQKPSKCPSTDEWIKMPEIPTHTHTQEYYSAVKKNEIMTFTAVRMDLEIIMLSKSKTSII